MIRLIYSLGPFKKIIIIIKIKRHHKSVVVDSWNLFHFFADEVSQSIFRVYTLVYVTVKLIKSWKKHHDVHLNVAYDFFFILSLRDFLP